MFFQPCLFSPPYNFVVCFVGKGTGILNIKSEAPERMISSEIYEVWDTLFAIDGTVDTDNWTPSANVTVSYSSEGTHFLANGSGGNQVNLKVNNSVHYFDGTTDKVYEFDLKTTSSMAIYIVDNGSGRRLIYQNPPVNRWVHFKCLYDASNQIVTVYRDDVVQTPVDLYDYNLTTIGLQLYDWQGDMDLWIRDLKIYNG